MQLRPHSEIGSSSQIASSKIEMSQVVIIIAMQESYKNVLTSNTPACYYMYDMTSVKNMQKLFRNSQEGWAKKARSIATMLNENPTKEGYQDAIKELSEETTDMSEVQS